MRETAEVAVGRLFEQHGRALYRLGIRFCGSADEAEDLVQDVFLQAFRRWHQFDGRAAPSTWLYTIAARRCQRRRRRRAGEPAAMVSLSSPLPASSLPVQQQGPGADPLDDAVRSQTEARLAAAIAELPPTLKLPLVLADVSGMPLQEVAEILKLKLGTVKSRIHRARAALRERLQATVDLCRDLERGEMPAAPTSRTFALTRVSQDVGPGKAPRNRRTHAAGTD